MSFVVFRVLCAEQSRSETEKEEGEEGVRQKKKGMEKLRGALWHWRKDSNGKKKKKNWWLSKRERKEKKKTPRFAFSHQFRNAIFLLLFFFPLFFLFFLSLLFIGRFSVLLRATKTTRHEEKKKKANTEK